VRFARGHLAFAAVGVLVGLVSAFAAMSALKTLLYGIKERDPVTFACVAVVILAVSALAMIPSRFRLRRINPSECLRSL
jgi:ABC-type antimicrobial peptide transport system permease subunit